MYYSLTFLLMSVVAGVLGFGVVPFAAAEIARICFLVFIILFLVSLILNLFSTRFGRAARDTQWFSRPLSLASFRFEISHMVDQMKRAAPSAGDFIVIRDPDGYAIERFRPGNGWEHLFIERYRLLALNAALKLARSAGTRAWTYEPDRQYRELSS
jgi:uncharacterized membrane protein YtjA (UPF0391 family)